MKNENKALPAKVTVRDDQMDKPTMDEFLASARQLLDQYQRQPHQTPETITTLPGYHEMLEAAVECGLSGPDVELDSEFSCRSPEWIAGASAEERRKWLHSVVRAERWNSEYPMAVLEALEGGQLAALVRGMAVDAPAK
ncbi:hypothetical protein [Afifella marina]|uniref:Uncharacterized protein n=1 Tax=Afifella marina DSM 2698 TaxID=1120955 RepID=A0A1G5NZW0_AFIMA|nr:hypothetical protein [Afifella marina]MBK1624930.1 hypothetical protein [Afifella marina DSM 2698]MBK1628633.1 hypothetical protein [Afifella marina]MBK5916463.1 hypothetical protein [Afifella marina]RAI17713.1 hypothetical protein CH311_17645 [Afifella marina DSM 2698]SCZ42240.1 hypothetical protein SAMN03080610_02883 [Afifella marina DSM 2698]